MREVWFALEATIDLWEEDGSGGYVSPATREEQYCQSASFEANLEVKKRRQPGKATPDITTIPDGFTISVRSWYERKDQQLVPFTDRTKRWRIRMSNINARYSGTGDEANDFHIFRDAAVTKWRLTRQDNEVQEYELTLEAERME